MQNPPEIAENSPLNQEKTTKKNTKENLWASLIFNIVIPSTILMKFSDETSLGPRLGLIVGLAFPLFYGAFDFFRRREHNVVSILGFVSILLTGSLSLLQVGKWGFAVKEASVPLLIAIFVLWTSRGKKTMIKTMFFNENLIDVHKVNHHLEAKNTLQDFEGLLHKTTYLLAASFIFSAIMNFLLAVILLNSAPNTPEFNAELGRMNMLSFPFIALPSTLVMMFSLWYLVKGVQKLTGLTLEEIFHQQKK